MARKVALLLSLALLAGCEDYIKPGAEDAAINACAKLEGLKYYEARTYRSPLYSWYNQITATCNSGAQVRLKYYGSKSNVN